MTGSGPETHPHHGAEHQLGDAVAALDAKLLAAQVDQEHLDFAAVVAVDGARSIQDRDPVAGSEARAGPDLRLQPAGNLESKPCRDQHARARGKQEISVETGTEIRA